MAPLEWRWVILCVRVSGKCVFSEMWQDLDGLGGAGVNSGAHQLDQFGTTGKNIFNKPNLSVSMYVATWQKSRFSLSERTRSLSLSLFLLFHCVHPVNKTKFSFPRENLRDSFNSGSPLVASNCLIKSYKTFEIFWTCTFHLSTKMQLLVALKRETEQRRLSDRARDLLEFGNLAETILYPLAIDIVQYSRKKETFPCIRRFDIFFVYIRASWNKISWWITRLRKTSYRVLYLHALGRSQSRWKYDSTVIATASLMLLTITDRSIKIGDEMVS